MNIREILGNIFLEKPDHIRWPMEKSKPVYETIPQEMPCWTCCILAAIMIVGCLFGV